MKILVTGGAGFIGSHLVDALINKDHLVSVLDNLSTGKRENLHPKAKFYLKDLNDPLLEILQKEEIEVIYHLAAQINVRVSLAQPLSDAQTNLLGTLNLLEAAHQSKVKKVIFASSAGVIYGEGKGYPWTEEDRLNPLSHYGLDKILGEQYLQLYQKLYGLSYTILRLTNVYGPRQDPTGEAGVVAIFINKILKDEQPIIYGDGKQNRDYIFVDDVINANLAALNKGKGEILNISTGKATSVIELFGEISSLMGYKEKPLFEQKRLGELQNNIANSLKAAKVLSWKPKFKLNQGLKKTIEWFRGR